MTQTDFEQIYDDALRLVNALCREPSVSAEKRALDSTAAMVEELLAGRGFETRQFVVEDAPPAVYGELRGRSEVTLLLYNHYDVQPADPLDRWDSPPFEPTIRDGRLFARGVADNKAEIAVRLAVIAALRQRTGDLPVTVRWIIEGEEEVLSPHFDEIVRLNAAALRADACLWEGMPARLPDGRPAIALGVKGALSVRLDVRVLTTDAHSALAPVVPSAAWRLVEALSRLRDQAGTVRIAGFYDAVVAPTEAERQAIAEQSDGGEREYRRALGLEDSAAVPTGPAWRELTAFAPTCNIAGIRTGYGGPGMKTVLPASASAWLDLRLVPEQHPDQTLALLRSHLDHHGFTDVEVIVLGSAQAAGTPIEHPWVERVAQVAERVTGRPASIAPRLGGSLPVVASLQRHLAVPGLSAPGNPFYFGSGMHAPNEHIRLEDLDHAARFTAALLQDLADVRHSPGSML